MTMLIFMCDELYRNYESHCNYFVMGAITYQITSLTIVYWTVYSGADQRKHQRSASLAFVWGIHRSPVNSPYKRPIMRKMFPFDDVIMVKEWRMCMCKHPCGLSISILNSNTLTWCVDITGYVIYIVGMSEHQAGIVEHFCPPYFNQKIVPYHDMMGFLWALGRQIILQDLIQKNEFTSVAWAR